ncbi:uncharacterized protein MYCGRDRAFT_73812 [Zymoseptoria tritici IPO323]|uniref:Protein farnesyltransferase/geranylgeranyltransferase type-1 subunit alpha n=1 Tax=Zymoseptoria tritici (strain CBS 115943 / IPO323) TaxID=336722 RepID=F9XF93_ZYMTI|nr:uncharacterized protein MYCGRDRAFT_73812 [Zymoseptoria tritici IPO323]EGP85616.1 hypothetical protein MYCGRDRAFT_73812 [Zymoseptoria tritici IPO323]
MSDDDAFPDYSTDPAWADLTPLPTDEGGPSPLAAIAYSEEYGTAMSYLRALMVLNEHSPRALTLTEHLISLNPAHYTVWLYRASILFALGSDLREELEWLSDIALSHQKNYQIWHHRNLIVDKLGSADGEGEFVERMFELDGKNYHVWSYRQWLVKRFGLWEGHGEMEFVERMLSKDGRNNSAWNHRWFVVNGREDEGVAGVKGDEEVRRTELRFAMDKIREIPGNQSAWSYLRGVVRVGGMRLKELKGFVEEFASLGEEDGVRSSHALDMLADVLAEEDGEGKKKAAEALDLLAKKYDPIRKNYWEYRKGLLGVEGAAA